MKVRITKVPDKSLNARKWNHKHADGGLLFASGGKVYGRDDVSNYGDKYYDVVRTRYTNVMDALHRKGFSFADAERLAPMIIAQNNLEGGWRLSNPQNNFGGMRANGKTLSFDSEADFYDAYLNMLDDKWGVGSSSAGNWRYAQNLDDWARILNHEDLNLWSKEVFDEYNRKHRDNPVYLYAPQWENNNKTYREHLRGVEGRTNAYLDMVKKDNPVSNWDVAADTPYEYVLPYSQGGGERAYGGPVNRYDLGSDVDRNGYAYYSGDSLYDPNAQPVVVQAAPQETIYDFPVNLSGARQDARIMSGTTGARMRLANVERRAPQMVVSSPVAGDLGTLLYNPVQQTYDTIASAEKNLGASDRKAVDTVLSGLKTREDVENFQRMLVDAGYDLGTYGVNKDGVDGKIGKKTRLAAEKYFSEKNKENIPENVVRDEPLYADPVDIYNTITPLQRISSMAFTVLPSHTGAYLNKSRNERLGKRLGIDNYDALLADNYINAENEYLKAQKNGTQDEKLIAYTKFNEAKKAIPTNKFNRKGLSKAEKLSALAILTGINGGKQMTYDDYVNNISKIGGIPGNNYLGTNSRHKNRKTGKDTFLYNGLGGYDIMNLVEDSTGYEKLADDGAGIVPSVIRAEQRIYNDPNRGRLGGFSYKVEPDGSIVIRDKLSAPEATPAKGKNDDAKYTAARKYFPRASTADIVETISAKEYRRIMERANKKKSKSNK